MTEVVFNEAEHTYHVAGVRWPSVTQVLDPLLELDGIPREALKAAADFGNHVHQACHLWDMGRLDEDDLDIHLRPYLSGWKDFLRDTGAVVLESERRVMHPQRKYAGTLDKIVLMKGRHVLDVKSGADVPWTVGMQTAGYREALWEEESFLEVDERPKLSTVRYCVHLKPDGSYRLHTLKDPTDFNSFISVLNVHHLRSRHGRKLG